MSELDFRKQLLINEFKTLSKGKKNDEMLPLVLAICNKAKQHSFTQMSALIPVFSDKKRTQAAEHCEHSQKQCRNF